MIPLGSSPNGHFLAVWLWASYSSSLSHLPITLLVEKAHLLCPEMLVALVLVEAVAASTSRVLPAQTLLFPDMQGDLRASGWAEPPSAGVSLRDTSQGTLEVGSPSSCPSLHAGPWEKAFIGG